MKPREKNNHHTEPGTSRKAGSGNASNPSVDEGPEGSQLLDEKAGTYIREAGNIEDLPDEKDQEDMDETFREA
jgi:hypothetical protein